MAYGGKPVVSRSESVWPNRSVRTVREDSGKFGKTDVWGVVLTRLKIII